MRTFKRIVGVLLIFLFGVFIGVAVTTVDTMHKIREMVLGGPEAVMDGIVKRLDHELKLDDAQKNKLRGIADDARIQLRQSRAKIQPEVEETLREAGERTRAILYPEQIPKFDALVKKSREKWKAANAANAASLPAPATPSPIQATPAPTTPAPETDSPPRTSVPDEPPKPDAASPEPGAK